MSKERRPWPPGATWWLGFVIFLVGTLLMPNYSVWRFVVGYQVSLVGAYLVGRGHGRQRELVRVRKVLEPFKALIQQISATQDAAKKYAAARARGPQ